MMSRRMSTAAQVKEVDQDYDQYRGQDHHVDDHTGLFREDGTVSLDPAYLRDSCRCNLCVDSSSLQRNFLTAHIPQDIQAIFEGHTADGHVKVRWQNDIQSYPTDHQTTFSQQHLDSLRATTTKLPTLPITRKRDLWDQEAFAKRASMTPYNDMLHSAEAYISALTSLHRDGLIFLTNVPAEASSITDLAALLGPLRNTFYGETWDVRSVPNSKNVAFTNHHLGFHMDLLYMANPPGYQLLHALRNSCHGGESLFADGFYAAQKLRELDAEAYEVLCRYEVEWRYENDGHWYWARRPTFERAEQYLPSPGPQHQQQGGQAEESKQQHSSSADHSAHGDLAYINWSPPFQGRLPYYPQQQNSSTNPPNPPLQSYLHASNLYDKILNHPSNVFQLKMDEGTCVIFENRRVVHARNAFELDHVGAGRGNNSNSTRNNRGFGSGAGGGGIAGTGVTAGIGGNAGGGGQAGERWLRGAYVDEDPVWSKWRGLGIES